MPLSSGSPDLVLAEEQEEIAGGGARPGVRPFSKFGVTAVRWAGVDPG